MLPDFKGTVEYEKFKQVERPGAKGVELFKKEKYEEAINEFTKFLKTMPDDVNKKVVHYNRGMAYYNLKQYDRALEDGEECLRIDPFWTKGYKCKGLALEGMGRLTDAEEAFLDGEKMSDGRDPNTEAILRESVTRLNRVTGLLGEDLDLVDRMRKEKYCAVCNVFEKDITTGDDKKFISCDRCKMVSYCCQGHMKDDGVVHHEVCEELLMIRKNSEVDYDIHILQKEDALVLLALKPKGPSGQHMVKVFRSLDLPLQMKSVVDFLKGVDDGNLIPLYQLAKFKPISKTQQKELNTWNDLFTMIDKKTFTPKMIAALNKCINERDFDDSVIKRTLTYVLTDPMTVFYAMKNVCLLENCEKDKVISLHVVGAEPKQEILNIAVFFNVVSNLCGCKLQVALIGPLVTSPPGQVEIFNPAITLFRGTYQDYILTSDYQKPDCVVALFPGLYDGTYNWLPAIVHAIANKVPFLITCDAEEDYHETKKWLTNEKFMKPEIVQDYLNPFCSWKAVQEVSGSNSISKRNMYSLLLMGGDIHNLQSLLQVEDEKFELLQVFCRLQGNNSMCDIMKLKKNGKM